MGRKFSERKFHLVLVSFLLGLFLGISASFRLSADEPAHRYLDYFHQVYNYILTEYVDEPQNSELFYGAIRGMIKGLDDPYSRFLDEKDFKSFKEDISGDFIGVGIEITVKDGNIVVISPIEGSPAMQSGIMEGDIITRVDGVGIKSKPVDDIVKLIRGRPNTRVKLEVKREGIEDPLDFELTRAKIHTKSVNYGLIEGQNIGYLRIKIFGDDTKREVETALKFFNGKNIDRIVIDLRGNPGGKLDEAIGISDFFLEKGKVIVTTKGRKGSGQVQESKARNDQLYRGKLIVLVNKGSASASEILAGALKDNNRGKLLGEKTFGKGSVQRLFELSDLVGITLTVAKYYTPSGASIHGVGIEPDISVSGQVIPDSERKAVNQIITSKVLEEFAKANKTYNEDSRKKFMETLRARNYTISERSANYLLMTEINRYAKQSLYNLEFDAQLNRAIAVLNGR